MLDLVDPKSKTADFDRKLGKVAFWLFSLSFLAFFVWGAWKHSIEVDVSSYWISAKLLIAHHNPYDTATIFAMEKAMGSPVTRAFLMRNPPWILPLVAPMGYVSLFVASFLCGLVELVLCFISIRLLRQVNGDAEGSLWDYLYAPMLFCLLTRQSTIFLLFGIAIYLWGYRTRPVLAGLGLALFTLKPHLVFLFWPVLMVETLRRRAFVPIIVAAIAVLGAMGFALHFDPQVFQHYLLAMRAEGIETQVLPNVPSILRHGASHHPMWVQLAPAATGMAWICLYYWRHHNDWTWEERLPLLVAVSTFLSPYSWFYDQTLFLPLILQWSRRHVSKLSTALALLANGYSFLLFFIGRKEISAFYAGSAVLWAIWWLVLQREEKPVPSQVSIAPV